MHHKNRQLKIYPILLAPILTSKGEVLGHLLRLLKGRLKEDRE